MAEYSRKRLNSFGGLNEDRNPADLKENDLTIAFNCAENGSRFGTRPGTAFEAGDYAAACGGAAPIADGYECRDRRDTGHLIVMTNDLAHVEDGVTLDKATNGITISAAQDERWTFMEHRDVVYGVGGADGDDIWRWADNLPATALTAVTFENAATVAIDAKFCLQKWNYGFLAGMNGAVVEDNPMVLRYSALNDLDTWPVGNTIGGSSAIGGFDSYGNNEITGLASFSDNDGDWLMVLTDRAIYPVSQTPNFISPFVVNYAIQNGCVGHKAYVSLGMDSGDAVYVSENGIHSIRQSQQHGLRSDRFLSWPIRDTFAGLNKKRMQYISGVYDEVNGRVLFTVPEAAGSDQSLILCMEIRDIDEITADTVRWRIWRLTDNKANCLFIGRDETTGVKHVYLGDYDGQVLRFQETTYQDITDAGAAAPYTVRWQTKHDDHESPGIKKGLGNAWVVVGPSGTYKPAMTPVFNYGTAQEAAQGLSLASADALWDVMMWDIDNWGSVNQLVQNRLYEYGAGFTTAWKFEHSGLNEPFFITGMEYQIRSLGESSGNV